MSLFSDNIYFLDHKAQMAVQLASKLYMASICKLMYAYEEIQCSNELEQIVTAIQPLVKSAANVMRSILSRYLKLFKIFLSSFNDFSKFVKLINLFSEMMRVLNQDAVNFWINLHR